jgi:YVTN family beta-propeller protein
MHLRFLRAASAAWVCFVIGCQVEVGEPDAPENEAGATVLEEREALSAAQAALARWTPVMTLPIVPVSAANLPDGKILFWSAEDRFSFGNDGGKTYTATFDPATGTSTERLVAETGHDMFCPGTANLPDGRILVNGGLSNGKTSIFNPITGVWATGAAMNIPRAYHGTAPLHDGSVLTLGGSWSGGVGNKHGEIWSEATGWTRLSGVPIDPFLSVDPTRNFGMDSHLWLLSAGNGRVFHGGPGINMNWVNTEGNGKVTPIGRRADDEFSINGNAVMYDIGKVLKVGGGPGYDSVNANSSSYVIELGASVNVRKIQPMAYRRAFQNSVVLPNGQVVVIGGATFAVGFSDNNSVLAPEIFDPVTETFAVLPPMSVPRNYHSIALLLPDGRVMSAGGGLCGNCAANHADVQLLSPPYLFNADGTPAARPTITAAPSQANHGTSMNVTTDSEVTSFALLRASSATHALNNDQRRLPLTFRSTGSNAYSVDVPSNPGWAVPGLYMLFAMNSAGVPSLARIVQVGGASALRIKPVDDVATTAGSDAALPIQVAGAAIGVALTYSVAGLPSGLSINPATGVIQGNASNPGRYLVEVSASDGLQTVSSEFTWVVTEPGTTRFVMFEARSELNGNAWSAAAEINLLDDDGQLLPRGAWTITADSAELNGQSGAPANAIDGDVNTIWHTEWQAANPVPPHWLKIDLGGSYRVGGLRYLPRQDASLNGTVDQFRVYLSADGLSWGNAVADGTLTPLGDAKSERTVYFNNVARGKVANMSSSYPPTTADRAVDGNTDGIFADNSLIHTNSEANAFWEVDLGAMHQIFAIRLWNRTDCCADRLSNFYVLASDKPMAGRTLNDLLADTTVAAVQVGGTAPAVLTSALRSRARYVRVQLGGTNFLQLAEVQVFGRLAKNRAPTLVQPVASDIAVGTAVTLQLSASDPDGDTLAYSSVNLPAGLTLDASTGLISGTASHSGSYGVDVAVNDGNGGAATAHFNWFVGATLPVLSPVPAPIARSGNNVSYTAQASCAGPCEYEWNFGDGTGDSGFGSSATASHSYAAPGVYTVTLTVRNSEGGSSSIEFIQAVGSPAAAGSARASSNLAFETRAGGLSARLWAVNPDNDTVSVFDAGNNSKVAEIAVGKQPRTLAIAGDGRVWVVNKGASTLSVINPTNLTVAQTINLPRAALPYGIVFAANGNAFVALEGKGSVLKLAADGSTQATLDVGASPRHLALTPAGDRLLVSRFITRFQTGEDTAFVQTSSNGVLAGGEVLLVNPASMTVTRTVTLQHSDKLDTTISGRGVPNYLGAAAISPDGQSAWIPSKQDNIQRGSLRDIRNLDFQSTVRAISSRIDLGSLSEDYGGRVDHDNSSVASAAVYHPNGVYLFVALETSRHLAVLDAYGKHELFRIDVGRAPEGVTLSADGRTLYVHNFMDRSVSVLSLARLLDFGETNLPLLSTMSSVASEKLSAQVLRGKQLFYDAKDARLARDAYMSCATCHNDGGADGRTWDITGMGEGLRNTISLRGHAGAQGRLHWSANFDEVQDFEGQIRSLTQGTGLMTDAQFNSGTHSLPLGDSKAGLSADLDALASYVASLNSFDASPYRGASGELTADAITGRNVFANQCVKCHGGNDFSDSGSYSLRDIGTIKASSGKRLNGPLTGLDTPTLRGVWNTAPYLHDGSAATIEAAIAAHTSLSLTAADLASVAAYTRQIDGSEPALAPPAVAGLMGQYFPNMTLAGSPQLTRTENIDYDWKTGAAATGLPVDKFSVRWSGQIIAQTTGNYRLQTVSDDGIRVRVNGNLVINNWTDHGPTTDTSANIAMVAGQRSDIVVEYYENGGGSLVSLRWLTPGSAAYVVIPAAQLAPPGVGLTGYYFANNALTGAPVLTRVEAPYFAWGPASPGTGVPVDNFSVRWTGQLLAPSSGTYRLQTISDDGVRLFLNGNTLVDNWTAHSPTADTGAAIQLVAGQLYDITLEYQELGVDATAQLLWLVPGATTYAPVAASQLYPTGVGLKGQYFANNALTGTAVLTRTEAVNFFWDQAAPGPGVPADNFSVRWSGQLSAPVTGGYRLQTISDDGVRVYLNGAALINDWGAHGPTTDTSAVIQLVAGQRYDLTIEYEDLGAGATMRFQWLTPNALNYVAVPSSQLHAF